MENNNKLPVFYQKLNEKKLEQKYLPSDVNENLPKVLEKFYMTKSSESSIFYKPISKILKFD